MKPQEYHRKIRDKGVTLEDGESLADYCQELLWFIIGLHDAGFIHDATIPMDRKVGGTYGTNAKDMFHQLVIQR